MRVARPSGTESRPARRTWPASSALASAQPAKAASVSAIDISFTSAGERPAHGALFSPFAFLLVKNMQNQKQPAPWQIQLAIRRISLLEEWVDRITPLLDRLDERLLVEEERPMTARQFAIELLVSGLLFFLGGLLGCQLWQLF